ncbi:MAG: glycosyltransferase [Elusimicrobia bacterium]|nr:glycosyltransferase [Elusimicrobiota bacterium]
MKILHMHWGFPPIIGGVETHLTVMLPYMAKKRHKVTLITGTTEKAKTNYIYKGIKVFRTPLMDLNWLYRRGLAGLDDELSSYFDRHIDTAKPDIIHVHNMHYFSKVHTAILHERARKKGIPVVLTAHNVWDDMLFLDLVKNVTWEHIIAVSHFIKKELIGVGCDDTKITVIHHGVDTDQFVSNCATARLIKRFPELKGRRVICHPARMGLAKGCDVSIKALNIVKDKFPDVMLVQTGTKNIIDWGETQEKDIAYIVGLMRDLKLEKYMLINVFNLDEMPALYALSEVCMYPSSVHEPFGLTMLEALSASRPMIVTLMGGMPEIIQDGINGYVVPVKDFEALAMRIMQLLDNRSLRNRLGTTGRQIVTSYYTKQMMTENVLGIYRKILGKQ